MIEMRTAEPLLWSRVEESRARFNGKPTKRKGYWRLFTSKTHQITLPDLAIPLTKFIPVCSFESTSYCTQVTQTQ
jgi:hypothetical protein